MRLSSGEYIRPGQLDVGMRIDTVEHGSVSNPARSSASSRVSLLFRRPWFIHLLVGVVLALFVTTLYYRLLFTNRVLATGDILLYFYPYREYVSSVLRGGELPFWNPYIFMGAPLLANPQAAVLYPLHWPLLGLAVTAQIYWSAAIHTWLLGYGGYWLMRRWGYGAWAGLTTALVLAGSGLIGGLIGHINQLNVAAWLPWAVMCVEGGVASGEGRVASGGRCLSAALRWASLWR